jgi:hypothetical protein
MKRQVAEFYYTEQAPAGAVLIARIASHPSTPAELTDINNPKQVLPELKPGKLVFTAYPVARRYDALVLMNSVAVSGSNQFTVENPFFELTDRTDDSGQPLYYTHRLPPFVRDVTVLTLDGSEASGAWKVEAGNLYHSMDGEPYWVRYYDNGRVHTELLAHAPVLSRSSTASSSTYSSEAGLLTVYDGEKKVYYGRFTEANGYRLLPPYNVLPNEPWYIRVRSGLKPVAPEWGRQTFLPYRPYMPAAWVPGKVLASDLVEFERRPIYLDRPRQPDVLVYDRDYKLKYALDGSPPGSPLRRGYLFPWKRGQIAEIDEYRGRLRLAVELDPTDRVFGFYYYEEPDIVYREIDINPHTNPLVKNRLIEFVYSAQDDPFQTVYHRVIGENGLPVKELSNAPVVGTTIGTVIVGDSVGLDAFSVEDIRSPGGGLAPEYQGLSQVRDYWDIGAWDGKPYPVGGALVVWLPKSILKPAGSFSKPEAEGLVKSIVPMGTIPIVRFYDANGEEEP